MKRLLRRIEQRVDEMVAGFVWMFLAAVIYEVIRYPDGRPKKLAARIPWGVSGPVGGAGRGSLLAGTDLWYDGANPNVYIDEQAVRLTEIMTAADSHAVVACLGRDGRAIVQQIPVGNLYYTYTYGDFRG